MSYTTLYAIGKNGAIAEDFEFRNSHGSAAYVWREMAARYCGGEDAYYQMMARDNGEDGMRRVWNLWKDPAVPLHQRAVMASTFDHVMVRAEGFYRLASDMEAFVSDFNPGDKVCSPPEQAATLRRLWDEGGCRAACWQQTSVAGDMWSGPWDEAREEETRPYNIDLDDKHWWLYEALDEQPTPA